jgi:hypothetical protein
MQFDRLDPPRRFTVAARGITHDIQDHGKLRLEPLEQVTFTTPGGGEYDVVRTHWGFYATPSTNGRLAHFGLRAGLVLSSYGKLFVMLVERDQEAAFRAYLDADHQTLLTWLDDDGDVARLADALNEATKARSGRDSGNGVSA